MDKSVKNELMIVKYLYDIAFIWIRQIYIVLYVLIREKKFSVKKYKRTKIFLPVSLYQKKMSSGSSF